MSCSRRLLRVPGIEVNRVSERGPTAAHLAGGECLKALTEDKRVDWNLMNGWRETPLMFNIFPDYSEDASIILDIPTVEVNVTDNHGNYVEDVARYPVLYLDGSVCKV